MKVFRRTAHVVFALILLIGFAAMLSASQPISDQGNQPNKDAPVTRESYESDIRAITDELRAINNDIARNEANRANNDKYWYVFGDNAPVWSNWFIFLTAIAAGGIAVRAFNHERQAVRLTQRADVLIRGIDVSSYPNPLNPDSMVDVTLKNYGATRASNVRAKLFFGINESECLQPPQTFFMLGASAEQHVHAPVAKCMKFETFKKVLTEEVVFRFWGTIEYTDVFGDDHTTEVSGAFFPVDCSFGVDRNQGN